MVRLAGISTVCYFILCAGGAVAGGEQKELTWLDCVREAQTNHPDLISAIEAVNQSKAGKDIRASGIYPQIDSGAAASTQKTTGGTGSGTSESYSYGVTASQLLFDADTLGNSVKAAEEGVRASQYNYRFVSSDVRRRLRAAFISLLRAQELVNINREIYEIRKGNFELIKLQYESGMEHKGAMLNGEAQLADAEFRIRQAERNVLVAQRTLTKEMGREYFTPIQVKGEFEIVTAMDTVPDFEGLAEGNPLVLRLGAEKSAARYNIRSSRGNFWPRLSVDAGADRSDRKWPPDVEQLSAGVQLSWPLFDGGLRVAELKEATAIFNQTAADERSGRDAAIVALEDTWQGLADAIEIVDVREKFLLAAEERSRIAEAQYATGFMSYDNWSIIEDNLVSAKEAYLDARANLLLAEADWIEAKGETLEYVD